MTSFNHKKWTHVIETKIQTQRDMVFKYTILAYILTTCTLSICIGLSIVRKIIKEVLKEVENSLVPHNNDCSL
jgi:hypothetical protein